MALFTIYSNTQRFFQNCFFTVLIAVVLASPNVSYAQEITVDERFSFNVHFAESDFDFRNDNYSAGIDTIKTGLTELQLSSPVSGPVLAVISEPIRKAATKREPFQNPVQEFTESPGPGSERKSEPESESREFRIGTNLLYDFATLANLNFEVGFARHIALSVPVTYSPWDIKSDFKLKTLLFQPELRYYFAGDFNGNYLGIEGHLGWFNCAFGGKIRYQDRDGRVPLRGAGLTYGYSLMVSKHCGFDFSISAGYTRLEYDCFYNIDNGARFTTSYRNWWGPTKVGVSFYYRFFSR